jgi:HTH-type transcriptional regulator / antitoxin HipB
MKLTIASSAQLSTHFKSLRRAKGWSQADLGRKLGIGQARVAQIENDPGSISVDKLLQIVHILDAKLVVDALVEPQLDVNSRRLKKPLVAQVLQRAEQAEPPKKTLARIALEAIGKVKSESPDRQNKVQFQSDLTKPGYIREGLLPSLKNPNRSPKLSNTKKKW